MTDRRFRPIADWARPAPRRSLARRAKLSVLAGFLRVAFARGPLHDGPH